MRDFLRLLGSTLHTGTNYKLRQFFKETESFQRLLLIKRGIAVYLIKCLQTSALVLAIPYRNRHQPPLGWPGLARLSARGTYLFRHRLRRSRGLGEYGVKMKPSGILLRFAFALCAVTAVPALAQSGSTELVGRNGALKYFRTGAVYLNSGRYEEAVKAYREAVRLNPEFAEAYNNLGVSLTRLKKYEEAIECFHQAIRLKPGLPNPNYNLGNLYNYLGRYEEALKPLRQAISLNPNYREAYRELGDVYLLLGRNEEAIEAYRQALRLNQDDAALLNNLGHALNESGRYEEAASVLRQSIRLSPTSSTAYNNLGVSYLGMGRYQQAMEVLKRAIDLQPGGALAYFNLGECYLMTRNKSAALEQYVKLKSLDRNLADQFFQILYRDKIVSFASK